MRMNKKKIAIAMLSVAFVATTSLSIVMVENTKRVFEENKKLLHTVEEKESALVKSVEENDKLSEKLDGLNDQVESLENRLASTKEELAEKQKKLSKIKSRKKIKVKVTGYCPCAYCCGEWAYKNPGITASGTRAKYGTIAAPKSIPFGTKMKIEGYGDKVFTVEDTGSAVVYKNGIYVIDMWMPTHSQAYNIGNKIVEAEIIN